MIEGSTGKKKAQINNPHKLSVAEWLFTLLQAIYTRSHIARAYYSVWEARGIVGRGTCWWSNDQRSRLTARTFPDGILAVWYGLTDFTITLITLCLKSYSGKPLTLIITNKIRTVVFIVVLRCCGLSTGSENPEQDQADITTDVWIYLTLSGF